MRSKLLIVNDDDHNTDLEKNRNIIQGDREVIVKATTIIVNGP